MKKAKRLISMLLALCAIPLSGCKDSGITSNNREIEQLCVIQTMGFDYVTGDIVLSAATGTGSTPKPMRLIAKAPSIASAQEVLQDYSTSEEMFYAHTSYVLLGREAAENGIGQYIDYIHRDVHMRSDIPLFVVCDGSASELVMGSGGSNEGSEGSSDSSSQGSSPVSDYDITDALRSLERKLSVRGSSTVTPASEVSASQSLNGSALVCAVKAAKASDSVRGAGDALTALPDGYAIIKDGRLIGHIPEDYARGVAIVSSKLSPGYVPLETKSGTVTVQLDSSEFKMKPIMKGGKLEGLSFDVNVKAALVEAGSHPDDELMNKALAELAESWLRYVMDTEFSLECDFLQLGSKLEKVSAKHFEGYTSKLQDKLSNLYYIINVDAEVTRSFDLPL